MTEIPTNRRLEQLLGASFSELDAAALQRLCDGAVREDADLEFKEALYGSTDSGKRDLAGDVAAMANTRDGMIVIGISEQDGAAAELKPVHLSEEEELRIRQVIASVVAPPPRIWVLRVPADDPSVGFYLLVVPRSTMAPHAVRVGEALRYPRRDGASVRWLSESEVADAYRNRFREARDQVDRLQEITEDGLRLLALESSVWVVVGLVPSAPGHMEIRHRLLRLARESWIPRWSTGEYGRRVFSGGGFHVESGVRRIVISSWRDDESGRSRGTHAELHSDGSGFAATAFGFKSKDDEIFQVFDEGLVEAAVMLSGLLVEHAVEHAGASGEAAMQLTLEGAVSEGVRLVHDRQFGFVEQFSGTRILTEFPLSRRTIDLHEASGSASGLLLVARMLATDVIQAFGFPEVPQITEAGEIRWLYLASNGRKRVQAWAEKVGVKIVETNLEQEP